MFSQKGARVAARWVEFPSRHQDLHVGFRGWFELDGDADTELRVLGSSWYRLWVDGAFLLEGPARFPASAPEFSSVRVPLSRGRHLIAAHVHHVGDATRMMPDLPGFLSCELRSDRGIVPIAWTASELRSHVASGRRTNPILSWVEWVDTRQERDWWHPAEDDGSWPPAAEVQVPLAPPQPLSTGEVRYEEFALRPVATGRFHEPAAFYDLDDPTVRFLVRDLDPAAGAEGDGIWRRYDLGRIRQGTPRFVLDLPAGSVVEFGRSDQLHGGRVCPSLPLSTGLSSTVSHFVARGGPQEFRPLTPQGQRYLEVHVLTDGEVGFLTEAFVDRGYFGATEGSFSCDNPLLERIWATGVETLRACSEDSVVDCPSRERGQWLGDVVSVGLEIAAVAFSDLRLFRRGLVQAAECADADGFVAGLYPGTLTTVATYSLQWVTACVRYVELTGDTAILEELFAGATRNLEAFSALRADGGLIRGGPWAFIDWGYAPESDLDVAYNLHLLIALQAYERWAARLGASVQTSWVQDWIEALAHSLGQWLTDRLGSPKAVEYHCAALALRAGLGTPDQAQQLVADIKQHMLACFPNTPTAPRLVAPGQVESAVITPFFAHWVLAALIEHGQMGFAMEQMSSCWGWMLEQGATTWWELFEGRWSRCHQWSGSPTWQLSRYAVGLHPRFDRGPGEVELRIAPGTLSRARGTFPLPDGGEVEVQWNREPAGLRVRLASSAPLQLTVFSGSAAPRSVSVSTLWEGLVQAWR